MNAQQLYDQVWNTGLEAGIEELGDDEMSLQFINAIELLRQSDTILEIGCGSGNLCNELIQLGFKNIIGTDISNAALNYGHQKYEHLDLRLMDATCLEFPDNTFEAVLSFDLVEHIPAVNCHLAEVYRVLKPGGKYLFQTPNLFSNAIFCTIKFRGFSWRKYHPSLQTYWGLRRRLLDLGFTSVTFERMPFLSSHKVQLVSPFIGTILKIIPWQKLPLLLQTNYYVVAYR